jgi:hypothetical protein
MVFAFRSIGPTEVPANADLRLSGTPNSKAWERNMRQRALDPRMYGTGLSGSEHQLPHTRVWQPGYGLRTSGGTAGEDEITKRQWPQEMPETYQACDWR